MQFERNGINVADIIKKETRVAYGEALAEIGEDKNIVVMDADLSGSTKTATFKKAFPERFINCGIAEGNMAAVAAGLACEGKTVFISSFAMFAAGRAFEQIRNSIAHNNLNVKICASHAGVTVGPDGATHQCNEDVAIMRTIPNMNVIVPADAVETRQAIIKAAQIKEPVYIRLGRSAVPVVFDESYNFELGKGSVIRNGSDATIIACGIMLERALTAADILDKNGVSCRVINMPCIKPIDKDIILQAAKETGAIVTAEEHSIIGGLGSAVAEVLCENFPTPMLRVGMNDCFGKSGNPDELLEYFGLTPENIAENALRAIGMKNNK